jgi:small subunit ribosomal protein S3
MGQKINPTSLRIGISKNWPVRWFLSNKQGNRTISATNSYRAFLEEDEAIRNIIKQKVAQAGIASVEIDRTSNNVKISICAARPGYAGGLEAKRFLLELEKRQPRE